MADEVSGEELIRRIVGKLRQQGLPPDDSKIMQELRNLRDVREVLRWPMK